MGRGAAQAGEESVEAVRREVFEETGIDVTNADGGYVLHIKERILAWEITIL